MHRIHSHQPKTPLFGVSSLRFWAPLLLAALLFGLASGAAHAKKKDQQLPKLAPPTFSHTSGFYPAPFDLVLSTREPDTTIYYTLDGSEPDPANLRGKTYRYKNHYQQPPKRAGEKISTRSNFLHGEYQTYRYSQPIKIIDRTTEPGRISRISTTYDENPRYFPELELDEKDLRERENQITQTNIRRQKYQRWVSLVNNRLDWIVEKLNVPLGSLGELISPELDLTLPKVPPISIYQEQFVEGNYADSGKRIYKGTPVRAIAVNKRGERSAIATHTLFIGDPQQFTLPIIAITVPEPSLFNYDDGMLTAGRYYDEWVSKLINPTTPGYDSEANFLHGKKKELGDKAAQVTFFQQPENITINAKIRVHGNRSVIKASKSIRLYPEKGTDKLGIKIFGEEKLGKFRINLRNAGGATTSDYMRDGVVHVISSGLAFGVQRFDPKITFINGEYNGILNARDRKDHQYLKDAYRIDGKQTDLLEKNAQVERGSADAYNAMLRQWKSSDPKSVEFYQLASSQIDLESFIDYFAASLFFARDDWPGNNLAYWRYTGEKDADKAVADGRWRWLLYDADGAFSKADANMLEYMTVEAGEEKRNPAWSTFMFRTLVQNPLFRQQFVTRFADLINTSFVPERTVFIIRAMEERMAPEIPRQIERWQKPPSVERWRDSIRQMVEFAERRPAIQRRQLQGFFNLGNPYAVNVDVNNRAAGTVGLNTLQLGLSDDELPMPPAASGRAVHMTEPLAFPWRGQYFQGMPLTLQARPRPGYRFSHWEVEGLALDAAQRTEASLTLHPTGDMRIKAVYRTAE